MRFGGPERSPQWVRDMVSHTIEHQYPQWGFGRYAVLAKDTGAFIGQCGLTRYRWPVGEAEVVYRFVPTSWGQGYATEATTAVCRYAFDSLGVRRILACMDPGNAPSINVAKKLGMTFDSEIPAPLHHNPAEHCYAITREQDAARLQ